MTDILFEQERETGEYRSFTFRGHAGFAKAGDDIVCAALSVLVINTINALETLCGEKPDVVSDEAKGEISCRLKAGQNEKERVLLDALYLGATGIEQEYGKKFCRVTRKEV